MYVYVYVTYVCLYSSLAFSEAHGSAACSEYIREILQHTGTPIRIYVASLYILHMHEDNKRELEFTLLLPFFVTNFVKV